ncbi:MAG: hypothetical protein J2P26_10245 [Nocardiopsaceae bacterium]|nr:hypothetical protein [Nocardiopsaceae bacterium]
MTTTPPASPDVPANLNLPALSRLFGNVVAPTTLLTAVLYYFGYLHAWYFFGYFGLNSTALGFGTVDYLIRSVDALFVPVTSAAILGLLALWGNALLVPRLRRAGRTTARITRGIAAGGAALAIVSAVLTFATSGSPGSLVALAPVGFGLGVLVTAYAVHLRRVLAAPSDREDPAAGWARVTEWAIVFALAGISLFAAATDYATAVGQSEAWQYAADLPGQPEAVLYSDRDLGLSQPGVTRCRDPDPKSGYPFRYYGLTLLWESGGRYVLIPADWTAARGAAIVLPEDGPFRLEFYPGRSPVPTGAGCR